MFGNARYAALLLILLGGLLAFPVRAQQDQPGDNAATVSEDDRDADRQLKAAARFFQSRQFEFAAETYEEFLKAYPEHPGAHEAQFFLGESLLHLKRYEEARKAYETYVKKYGTGSYLPWALFRAGEAAYLAGDWDTAVKHLRAYLDNQPGHRMRPYALRYLGEALLQLGKPGEAKELLESALRLYGRLPIADRYRYALAQIEEQNGNIEQALQYYLAVGQGNSDVADDALLAAGTIEYERKRYAHARQLFENLLRRFPDSPLTATAHFNNGLALYQLKGYQQAASHFQLVRTLAGDSPLAMDASLWLARCYAAEGRTDEAVRELLALADRAKEANVADAAARALNEAARLVREGGDTERAMGLYLRLAREFPEHELAEHALVHAVQAASELARADEAERIARDFLQLYPDSTHRGAVALAVARAALAAGRPELAESWLEPALKSEDERVSSTARYYRALILADRGDYGGAFKELEGLLAKPETVTFLPEAFFLAGRCAFALNRYEEALRQFTVFLQGNSDHELSAHARAYRAICYAHLGRRDDAMKELSALSEGDASLYRQCLLACADAFYAIEAYDAAGELYRKIAGDPEAPEDVTSFALAGAAWSDYYAGKYAEALKSADEFLARFTRGPIVPEMVLLRGYALKKLDRLDEAIESFQQVLQKYPDSPLALDAALAAARSLTQADRFEDAARYYQICLKRLETDLQEKEGKQAQAAGVLDEDTIRLEYAWALWKAGRAEESLEQYKLLIERSDDPAVSAQAKLNAAQLLIDRADQESVEEAIALLVGLLETAEEPGLKAQTLFQLARASMVARRWSEAEEYARRFLETAGAKDKEAEAYYILVESLYEQSKGGELAEAVERALEVTDPSAPWWPTLRIRQAQVLLARQSWQEALEVATEVGRTSSSPQIQALAAFYRGRARMGLGQLDEAIADFKEALKSPSPEVAARAQFMIGEVYFGQGKYHDAIREFLKVDVVYDLPRWRAAALVEAGKCYEQLNETRAAADLYKRVVNEFAEEPVSEEARKRLEALQQSPRAGVPSRSGRL